MSGFILTLLAIALGLALTVAAYLGHAAWRTRKLAAQAVRDVPMAGELQPVPGGMIHFVDSGPRDAPPIVLIHGLSGQLQHFTYGIAPRLSDVFRVIAIDRPGSGYSDRRGAADATLETQARMIAEFLSARGIEKPLIVGHSLGGAVALALALQRPDDISGLALLCPLTHPTPEPPAIFRALMIKTPALRRLLGHTIAVPMALRTAKEVLDAVFAPEDWPQDFLERGGGALGLRPRGFIAASEDMVASQTEIADQAARYAGELKLPGAVLFGAEDQLLDPEAQGKAMTDYGWSFETLPGRGHMIPITAPEDCAAFIARAARSMRGE
ncbi:Pimeloyl-ACP methyl ester carboxylesterase [Salinihabitans flavidus]|uniref:Pimeloyl-ACP methyl ester carboxylesterase n=1 Tax=Salinihabitans flavidus TaxID=569882 RepID=A0A1H8SBK3_9RHOB|nr:alpha/beta fold hydrolase [Salinihabitans flavidus]SEO75955.1 Pimeloyl-ACP methyl ester carboxylesterase [Salinihabitans flavidus]